MTKLDPNELVVMFCNKRTFGNFPEGALPDDAVVITEILKDEQIIVVSLNEFEKWLSEIESPEEDEVSIMICNRKTAKKMFKNDYYDKYLVLSEQINENQTVLASLDEFREWLIDGDQPLRA